MKKLNSFMLLLVSFMFVGVTTVKAEDKEVTEFNDLVDCIATAGNVCQLTKDLNLTDNITINANVTIDLKGKNLKSNDKIISVANGITLTVSNTDATSDNEIGPINYANKDQVTIASGVKVKKLLTPMDVATIDNLVTCVGNADTVCKLTAEFKLTKNITIAKSVTIDLNSKNLTAESNNQSKISITGQNVKLTLLNTGNGTVEIGPVDPKESVTNTQESKITVRSTVKKEPSISDVATLANLKTCLADTSKDGCRLTADINFSEDITITRGVIIDLNKHNLISTSNKITVSGNNVVEVWNTNATTNNKIGQVNNADKTKVTISSGAKVEITYTQATTSSSGSSSSYYSSSSSYNYINYKGTNLDTNNSNLSINTTEQANINKVMEDTLKNDTRFRGYTNLATVMKVEPKTFTSNDKIKTSIENKIASLKGNYKLSTSFYDISINVVNDNKTVLGNLTELKSNVTLELTIPELDKVKTPNTKRTYYVLREHNGQVDVLNAEISKDGKKVVFKTDKFSTYVLAYTDNKVANVNPNTLDNTSTVIAIMGLSLINLLATGLYIKKLKKVNY